MSPTLHHLRHLILIVAASITVALVYTPLGWIGLAFAIYPLKRMLKARDQENQKPPTVEEIAQSMLEMSDDERTQFLSQVHDKRMAVILRRYHELAKKTDSLP